MKLFGPEYGTLHQLAEQVSEALAKKGKGRGLKEVNSNVFAGNPDLLIRVDGIRASRYGLTPAEIERQLQVMYFGQVATQVRESALRLTDVRVRYPNASRFGRGRFDPGLLDDQFLLLPAGAAIASGGHGPGAPGRGCWRGRSGLCRCPPSPPSSPVRTPDEQVRENQQPAAIVTAELAENEAGLGSVVTDVQGWMSELEHGRDWPRGYRWEMGGHYVRQKEAFRSFGVVMAVAILLVFIMLAFQFRSVALPLLIFLTQPLSLVSGCSPCG